MNKLIPQVYTIPEISQAKGAGIPEYYLHKLSVFVSNNYHSGIGSYQRVGSHNLAVRY